MDKGQLKRAAQGVLDQNDVGPYTKPAPGLYPHQWNWDTAFIAIGQSHTNSLRAQNEIRSLLRGQWTNGMVPHIVFNPAASDYHPGPEYWETESSNAGIQVRTSGITQPSLLAYACLEIYHNSNTPHEAEDFLREIYDPCLRESKFLIRERDHQHEGMVSICHPWESGMDNSPSWDAPLHRFPLDFSTKVLRQDTKLIANAQRPSDAEYERYSYLVKRYAQEDWDQQKIHDLHLFQVQSVLFNTLRIKSLYALADIAELIGEPTEDLDQIIKVAQSRFDQKLWEPTTGSYLDYDLSRQNLIGSDSISQFLPLFAGIPSSTRAETLIARLQSPAFWPEDGWGICSQSMSALQFDGDRYWRGPVWINMNWMIIKGLERYGRSELARRLAHKTLELVHLSGFYEYFNPRTGQGLGSDAFSWTAALVLDLIASGYGDD